MSKIAETYGIPATNLSEVRKSLLTQRCPILGFECDGGGNRYSSDLEIRSKYLIDLVPNRDRIRSSICSLSVGAENTNWVVCPRRLLSFEQNSKDDPQQKLKSYLFDRADIPRPFSVWKEVKLKVKKESLTFDYTFDYVLSPVRSDNSNEPIGGPIVIEVMTSSTSGGNRRNRTTIQQCFEDLLLGHEHDGPGINYRQVWGRMISQFFVKSMVASAWQGRTFWVIQDSLLDYIERSTGFERSRFKSEDVSDVNLVSVTCGSSSGEHSLVPASIEMYSGVLDRDLVESFYSILATPMTPALSDLHRLLRAKQPVATFF